MDQRVHVSMDGQDPSVTSSCVNPSAMIMEPVPMEPVPVTRDGMVIIVVSMDVQLIVLAHPRVTVSNHNQQPQRNLNQPVVLVLVQSLDPTTITGPK